MTTPGVYIVEKNAFPNSVVEVETAVPAFVGWTECAEHQSRSLHLTPQRINSLADYHALFGGAPTAQHVRFKFARVTETAALGDPTAALSTRDATLLRLNHGAYALTQTGSKYLLYYAMQLFFQNGGGACYVVSTGEYGSEVDAALLTAGVHALTQEIEPTMLVIPEAMLLTQKDCLNLQNEMLQHCGQVMKNRVALLDVWEGYRARGDAFDVVTAFRDGLGHEALSFGAAYYPWVHTMVVQERELSCGNIAADESLDTLITCLKEEIAAADLNDAKKVAMAAEVDKIKTATDQADKTQLSKILRMVSPFFKAVLTEMAKRLNLLPPAAAMAGIWTMVDQAHGVWKAPANVSLSSVAGPAVQISSEQQGEMNVPPCGKSINALRSFVGEGVLVWGARTLDGNSLDGRYINVRRTVIMLEQSIRLAAQTMVFEPNVANTWVAVKAMISNFLISIWKRGGLAGAMPEEAFMVHVGLGETMTPQDILDGILRLTVLVAVSQPAEFIEISFQQPMQTR